MAGAKRGKSELPVFGEHFGIDARGLDSVFATALAKPIDYADVFFEYTTRDAVSLEEGLVKSGARAVEQGVGVRAQAGERQGYAHADEISLEAVKLAAGTARAIARGPGQRARGRAAPARAAGLRPVPAERSRRPRCRSTRRCVCCRRSTPTRAARDPRIAQVMASVACEERHLMIAASDGDLGRGRAAAGRAARAGDRGLGRAPRVGLAGHRRAHRLREARRPRDVEAARRRGGAHRAHEPRGRELSRGHDGRRARARLAGHPAARGGRPRARGRLQPQEDLGLRGPARPAGRVAGRHGRRRRHDAGPARLAQRRRRGHADRAHRADRERHPGRLHAGPAERAAHGHDADRQRTARELPRTCRCRA